MVFVLQPHCAFVFIAVFLSWVVLCTHEFTSCCPAVRFAGAFEADGSARRLCSSRTACSAHATGGGDSRSNLFDESLYAPSTVLYAPSAVSLLPPLLYCGSYVRLGDGHSSSVDSQRITVDAPLSFLAPRLPHRSLQMLVRLHSIHLPRGSRKLDDLPLNRVKERIRCQLPTDAFVYIDREQIKVLQNFAMTDFCSQGRTRPYNPCHLTNCRGHQSMYTCLSRSASLDGTVIVGGFDVSKIRGGLSGALRREFRALEILDEIGRLRSEGSLPDDVTGTTRGVLISAFQRWKGSSYVPDRVPSALSWSGEPDQSLRVSKTAIPWKILEKSKAGSRSSATKRRAPASGNWQSASVDATDCDNTSKRRRLSSAPDDGRRASASPTGFIWDSENWSCAYDSTFFILWNVFLESGPNLARMESSNVFCRALFAGFRLAQGQPNLMEVVRNQIRDMLASENPVKFPRYGRVPVAVADVVETVLRPEPCNAFRIRRCQSHVECGHADSMPLDDFVATVHPSLWDDCEVPPDRVDIADSINVLWNSPRKGPRCTLCGQQTTLSVLMLAPPSFVAVELFGSSSHNRLVSISDTITVNVHAQQAVVLRLVGIIYAGGNHFTARYLDQKRDVWYHDGAVTARATLREISPALLSAHGLTCCTPSATAIVVCSLRYTYRGDHIRLVVIARIPFHYDLQVLAAQYADFPTPLHVRRSSPETMRAVSSELNSCLTRPLARFVVDVPAFGENMRMHAAVVTGPAAVQFFARGDNWQPDEFKLTVPCNHLQSILQHLLRHQDVVAPVQPLGRAAKSKGVLSVVVVLTSRGRIRLIHSDCVSGLFPISQTCTTLEMAFVCADTFSCAYPSLTFRRRGLIVRHVFRPDEDSILAFYRSRGFSMENHASGWPDGLAVPCVQSWFCLARIRYFGAAGTLTSTFESTTLAETLQRARTMSPYGMGVMWYLGGYCPGGRCMAYETGRATPVVVLVR